MTQIKPILAAGSYALLLFIVSLTLTWGVLYKLDFMYPVWHDYGGIAEGIEKFGPQNRYKLGFGDTSYEQRYELFHQINLAVHSAGEGLAEIQYQTSSSRGVQTLLREPEVVHLQDVAHLIGTLLKASIFFILSFLLCVVLFLKKHKSLPSFKAQSIGLGGILLSLGACLLIFGAENVFNQLHIWIFPDEHQWFFYYQDSLMSTMMLAPLLFAWIAGAWFILALLTYIVLHFGIAKAIQTWCKH